MFSLLWSEHCAYKHSRKLLRRLPTEGERVVMGPGENAGAVDVGNGHAVAFKVESHNHPSAVEPFQGAATGVGGILRDVFAIGARPIAVLDSLRFGELVIRALPLPVRGRRRRHRPLRQLDRGPRRGRGGLLRTALRAQLPGQRDVRRAGADRRDDPLGRCRSRESVGDHGRLDGAGRDRWSVGARLGRAGGGRRLEAAERPDRRSLRGVEAARVLPRTARAGPAGLAPGPRCGRTDLVGRRDGVEGRRRDRHRRGTGASARAGPRALRGDDLRVPGADARGGRAGTAGRGGGDLRALADRLGRDRRDHRWRSAAGPRRRRRGRERAGGCPGRRMPAL